MVRNAQEPREQRLSGLVCRPLGAITTVCSTIIFVKIVDVLCEFLFAENFAAMVSQVPFTDEVILGNFKTGEVIHVILLIGVVLNAFRLALSLLSLEFNEDFQNALGKESGGHSLYEWFSRLFLAIVIYAQCHILAMERVSLLGIHKIGLVLLFLCLSHLTCLLWDWVLGPKKFRKQMKYWRVTDPLLFILDIILVMIVTLKHYPIKIFFAMVISGGVIILIGIVIADLIVYWKRLYKELIIYQ